MAAPSAAVRFTANFESNLLDIETFWLEQGAKHAYAKLLDALGDTAIPNLENHPRIGRKFFARSPMSIEGRQHVAALVAQYGDAEVREYLCGDYLILYCVVAEGTQRKPGLMVYLLAIRHHRQLSFDFDGFWQANRGEDV